MITTPKELHGTVAERRGSIARVETDSNLHYLKTLWISINSDVKVGDAGKLTYQVDRSFGGWTFRKD